VKNPTGTHVTSNAPRWRRMLAVVWRWLIEPSPSIVEPERRLQARLLMAMLLILIILGLLSLTLSLLGFYAEAGETETVGLSFRWITLAAVLVLAVEYGLSRTVHYPLAAVLIVVTLLIATFLIAIITPDPQFLYFLILGGLVGSLFLSARVTAMIFAITLIGLMFQPALAAGVFTSNNMNALFFILAVGGLVVMAAALRQRYLEQLDWRTQQLVESEARLRELSIRDPLTGLFNRRYLEEVLALEMIRAVRKQYPIGIIMADIDHFKRFNDTHGHAAGDAVLVQVGNLLRTHVRSSDVTCRYGGEEFILILPEASRKITQMRAELIRKAAGQFHPQYEDQTLESVTLSLGVAVFPDHGSTEDAVLKATDDALYRAKREGRDRVVVADSESNSHACPQT
jgi:diguanylate cyclase (GGDEF)-like protein